MKEATLILGSASELGKALVTRLHADGQAMVAVDAVPCAEGLPLERAEVLPLEETEELEATLATLAECYAFTRLIMNPASLYKTAMDEMPAREMLQDAAASLHLPLVCLQAVLPAMRESAFGSILTVTSFLGLGEPGFSYESARISALHSATRTWSLELGEIGITVNAISAGVMNTPESRKLFAQGDTSADQLLRLVPLRRYCAPADVAEMASFLLSERAAYVTGQVLNVCGGLTVGRFGGG